MTSHKNVPLSSNAAHPLQATPPQPYYPPLRDASDKQSCAASLRCEGAVSMARGFKAAGMHAGFRRNPTRFDLALVVADEPCAAAATFTTNVFCAAPVRVSQDHLEGVGYSLMRGCVINSANANAATGEKGLQAARETARMVGDVLGCPATEILVASTGVIGVHLPLDPFVSALPAMAQALSSSGGDDAARAIMTTDTCPKQALQRFSGDDIGYKGQTFTVGGMAKGSGMIMPMMATMIAVITTDAPLAPHVLHRSLKRAVSLTFNKVTIDSDTSTNDCCFAFASGAAASKPVVPFATESTALAAFDQALQAVCQSLARQMACDGEGATRLITINVSGAASPDDADCAARAVANSPLVKTAVCGHDANWGRIAMALGKSGAQFNQEAVAIDIMGLAVCRGGLTVAFDEDEALRRFEQKEIIIDIDLGAGSDQTQVWTCDLTKEYVAINGDYRS